MKLLDYSARDQLRNRGRYREMERFRSNQTLELTATRRAFRLFSVFRPLSSDCMLALGGGSSAYSR